MKRLIIIGPRAFPSSFAGTSGVEVYVEEVVRKLLVADRSVEVTILTRSRYQRQLEQVPHDRLKVIGLWSFPGRVLEAISYCFFASMYATFSRADVIWFHTAGMSIFAWIPKLLGRNTWLTVHSPDWKRRKWHRVEKSFFYHFFLLAAKYWVNHLFAVNEALAEQVEALTTRPVMVTLPGLPTHSLSHSLSTKQLSKPYVLYLGRLVPEKRIEWLLRYAIEYHVNVLVAGSHGNLPEYEERLRQLHQAPNITWLGSVMGKAKWQLLQQAQLLVLPSELEGFPIVIMEALQARTPALLHQDILPSALNSLPLIFTFSGQNYEEFAQTMKKTLRKVAHRRPRLTRTDLQSLRAYNWLSTARLYARFL